MATGAFEVNGYFRTLAKWRQTKWRSGVGRGSGTAMVRCSELNPCCKAFTHPHPYGIELHRYPPRVIVGPIIELATIGPFQVATVYDDHRGRNVFVTLAKGPTLYASPGWPNPDEIAAAGGMMQSGIQEVPHVTQCRRCGSPIRSGGRTCPRSWSDYCGIVSAMEYDDIECDGCGLRNWRWRRTCRQCGL